MANWKSALCVGIVTLTAGAQAQQLEFKGVPFGATVDAFQAAHPLFNCLGTSCQAIKNRAAGTFAGEMSDYIMVDFCGPAGLCRVAVGVRSSSYEPIAQALKSKYGSPTTVTASEVKTRGGLVLANEETVWQGADGYEIRITKHTSAVDAMLIMRSSAGIERDAERAKERATKAKKDI